MKKIYLLGIITIIAFTTVMCNRQQNNTKTANHNTESFDWLLGNWKRTNEEKGKKTFENWYKTNDSEYNGIGFTLQDKDTISQEQMKLVNVNGMWNLFVKAPSEKKFTRFEVSDIGKEMFECKNDTLDFPKLIQYWKKGDRISAVISGGGMKINYEFEKIK